MLSRNDMLTSDNFKRLGKHTPLHLKLMLDKQTIFEDDIRLSDVRAYIDEQLAPYNELSIKTKKEDRTTFEHAKRALSLAITFDPKNIERILTLYPKLLSCVLEQGNVKIKNLKTNEYEIKRCDFKLAHLLAREGSWQGVESVYYFLIDKHGLIMAKNKLDSFLSHPMRFSNCSEETPNAPTPAVLAIINKNADFFAEMAGFICQLESDHGFSQFYDNNILVRYEVLQQMAESEATIFLDILCKHCGVSSVVNKFFDLIMSKALKGDVSWLTLFLNTPSIQDTNFIPQALFEAISATNLAVVKLVASYQGKIDAQKIVDEQSNSPLLYAIIRAKENEKYLPIVQYFICSGYSRHDYYHFERETIDTLLEEKTKQSFFSKKSSPIKSMQYYVNGLGLFHNAVYYYIEEILHTLHYSTQIPKNPPEKLLFNTAKQLDSVFFNQLVVGFLDMRKEATKQYFDLCKSYFICLYNFSYDHDGIKYMTSATLEYIADALVTYKLSRSEALDNEAPDLKDSELITYFYKQAMNHKTAGKEDLHRILPKLKEHDLKETQEDHNVIRIS